MEYIRKSDIYDKVLAMEAAESGKKPSDPLSYEVRLVRLNTLTAVEHMISSEEPADVTKVRHARWVHTDWAYSWSCLDECSSCGYHDRDRKNLSDYVYCPMCGAIMDLEE